MNETTTSPAIADMIAALDGGLLPDDQYDHRTVREVYDAGLIADSDVASMYAAHQPLTVACHCGAQAPRPLAGYPVTCEGCGWQIVASVRDPGEIFYMSPEIVAGIADPKWTASHYRSYPAEVVTVTYRGSAKIYYPVTDPADSMYGGSREETILCPHALGHADFDKARECGDRTARRVVAQRNAAAKGSE